jgi:hypothetical protein
LYVQQWINDGAVPEQVYIKHLKTQAALII